MEVVTVDMLLKECIKLHQNGKGNMKIMITSDDEGNSYHYLWYGFQSVKDYNKEMDEYGFGHFEWLSDNCSNEDDTILLG
jgi:hypothetical protein